jgi:hypothetical protein
LLALAIALAASPTLAADEEGFVSLFDGKTLNGWIGATDGYVVRDGAIVCDEKKGGNLFTEKEYANFVLRLEIQIPPGGNNGLAIRAPNEQGNIAYAGTELQVLDDPSDRYKNIKPYQHHGSIYGCVPAKPGSLKPAGEWNEEEVTVDGKKFKVVVNGQTIVEADVTDLIKNGTPDGKAHPGLQRTSGHIGFLGHGAPVAFRNIRIKELPAK